MAVTTKCTNLHKRGKMTITSFESTAKILVGKAKEEFIFHKSFLCSLAPFFRAALEGHFKEASEEAITMPEETPMVVRRFQLWAYSGSILQDDETAKEIDWDIFVRLYIFAERYDLPELQNAAVDTIVDRVSAVHQVPACVGLIYKNTTATSPLRRLLVDMWAQQANLDIFDWSTVNPPYPFEFMSDLSTQLYKLNKKKLSPQNWGAELGCTYHVHPTTTACSKQVPNEESG